eukprot:1182806-Prorocentrum_minimum.AAC.1
MRPSRPPPKPVDYDAKVGTVRVSNCLVTIDTLTTPSRIPNVPLVTPLGPPPFSNVQHRVRLCMTSRSTPPGASAIRAAARDTRFRRAEERCVAQT